MSDKPSAAAVAMDRSYQHHLPIFDPDGWWRCPKCEWKSQEDQMAWLHYEIER